MKPKADKHEHGYIVQVCVCAGIETERKNKLLS
jgi:hypothetical protein